MIDVEINIGDIFGRLTVTERLKGALWLCTCECGNTCERHTSTLLRRNRPSCGCVFMGRHPNSRITYRGGSSKDGQALTREQLRLHGALHDYKKRIAKKGMCWELSDAEAIALMLGSCVYCGKVAEGRNGIDRVDSGIGYTLSNCVSCCAQCNYAKRDQSLADFEAWISRLIAYRTP